MIDILGYLAPMIVFAAGIVGLLGPRREGGTKGIGSITSIGWASAGLAALSLAVSLFLIHTRQQELATARNDQQRLRVLAAEEIGEGLHHLEQVLRFVALIPVTTTPVLTPDVSDLPFLVSDASPFAESIDLGSAEVVEILEETYFSPQTRLNGPFVPSSVPFGTDNRKVFDIPKNRDGGICTNDRRCSSKILSSVSQCRAL